MDIWEALRADVNEEGWTIAELAKMIGLSEDKVTEAIEDNCDIIVWIIGSEPERYISIAHLDDDWLA